MSDNAYIATAPPIDGDTVDLPSGRTVPTVLAQQWIEQADGNLGAVPPEAPIMDAYRLVDGAVAHHILSVAAVQLPDLDTPDDIHVEVRRAGNGIWHEPSIQHALAAYADGTGAAMRIILNYTGGADTARTHRPVTPHRLTDDEQADIVAAVAPATDTRFDVVVQDWARQHPVIVITAGALLLTVAAILMIIGWF